MALVRTEQNKDNILITQLISNISATSTEKSNIEKLKRTTFYDKELSLVIQQDEEIIGHILFARVVVKNENKTSPALVLASLILKDEYNSKENFKYYLTEGLKKIKYLGHKTLLALGDFNTYNSLGFKAAEDYALFGNNLPTNKMLMIHTLGYEEINLSGNVYYPVEFESTYLSSYN